MAGLSLWARGGGFHPCLGHFRAFEFAIDYFHLSPGISDSFRFVMTFDSPKHSAPSSLINSGFAQLSDPIFSQLFTCLVQFLQLFSNDNSSLLGFLEGYLKGICDAVLFHQPSYLSGANGLVGSIVNNLGPQHS